PSGNCLPALGWLPCSIRKTASPFPPLPSAIRRAGSCTRSPSRSGNGASCSATRRIHSDPVRYRPTRTGSRSTQPDRLLDPGQGGVGDRGKPLGAFLEGPAQPGVVLADLPIPLLDRSERLDHGLGHPPLQLAVWLAGKFFLDRLPAERPEGTEVLEQVGDA